MQYEITEAEAYEIKQAQLQDVLDEQVNYKNFSTLALITEAWNARNGKPL
jgi:hypothetical protein